MNKKALTAEDKRAFIANSAWFHRINVGDEIGTPGMQDCSITLGRIGLPADLADKEVIDIGANDGYFSFECERRGGNVTSLDMWDRKYDNTRAIENIKFCKDCLGSKIKIVQSDILEYQHEPYDLVLFMGVLYHMQSPMAGLRKVADLTKDDGMAIIETHCISGIGMNGKFYPGEELNHDPTNWWGFTAECAEAMISTFFRKVRNANTWGDRVTFHAWEPIR